MKTMVNKKPDGNTDAAASSNAGADAAQQWLGREYQNLRGQLKQSK